eukprot:1845521-Rhodomonas_salina.1
MSHFFVHFGRGTAPRRWDRESIVQKAASNPDSHVCKRQYPGGSTRIPGGYHQPLRYARFWQPPQGFGPCSTQRAGANNKEIPGYPGTRVGIPTQ